MIKKILASILLTTSLYSMEMSNIGVNVLSTYMDYTKRDKTGSISLGDKPNKELVSFEFFTVLDSLKYEDLKPEISYIYSNNSKFVNHLFLLGYNKYFKLIKSSQLYAGVLLGYGELRWHYDPFTNSSSKNVDSDSIVGGIQLGIDMPINQMVSLNINGKYLSSKYETSLSSGNAYSTITHNLTTSLGVGLVFRW